MDPITPTSAIPSGKTIVQLPDNIAIREYTYNDIPSLSHHGNTRQVWDQLRNRMPHPYTEAAAQAWITHCLEPTQFVRSGEWTSETGSQGPPISTSFAIAVAGEAVGSIGLEFGDPDDIYFRTAEIGYWLSPQHWGKGIMSRLLPAFVQWSWETFGVLIRLSAETAEGNPSSGRVLQKAGFVLEGRRPDMACKNGVVGAELMWGVLRPR
ncbi:hypothetical protein KC343_g7432 [Hortaea werneckii]|nr:hypothetical protein KC352_g18763 [Hortaea werneckii]KAI7553148.1 hypothetical protein KC317_g13574 [Hortaea werneckii]KAI7604640.1 hypothetical protein KC346_g11380 [Hortaea werneckii]KAI7623099.1 hypothetical protein KC343_g7432 [Hortaea werneckii]KAI7669636.1 hypothetical protein KC319_g6080 [Hortaea werneckii]